MSPKKKQKKKHHINSFPSTDGKKCFVVGRLPQHLITLHLRKSKIEQMEILAISNQSTKCTTFPKEKCAF